MKPFLNLAVQSCTKKKPLARQSRCRRPPSKRGALFPFRKNRGAHGIPCSRCQTRRNRLSRSPRPNRNPASHARLPQPRLANSQRAAFFFTPPTALSILISQGFKLRISFRKWLSSRQILHLDTWRIPDSDRYSDSTDYSLTPNSVFASVR
jgi:hypothetical protein